jgi:transposase InsO family protein
MDKFSVARFDGTNFHLWKFQLRILLQGQDLWEVTDGTHEKPEASSADATRKDWNTKNNKAMMYITQSLDTKQLSLLINCEKACEMWSKLTSIYEQRNTSSIHMIQQMFFEYKMDETDDMATHISKVENLARRLKDLGEEPTSSSVITKILCSLPASYRHIVSAWDATPKDQQTLDTLTARLLKEEEMNKQMDSVSMKNSKCDAYFVHGKKQHNPTRKETKKKGSCNYCKKPGHWFKECRKRKRDMETSSGSAHVTQGVASASVLIAYESNTDWNQEWVADSGATHHMTPRREWFESLEEIPEGCFNINIANKDSLSARGRGSITVEAVVEGRKQTHTLSDVLFVPGLSKNLFSISKAASNGCTAIMTDKQCQIMRDQRTIAVGVKKSNLYRMLFKTQFHTFGCLAEKNPKPTLMTWHNRLAHVNMDLVKRAVGYNGSPSPEDRDHFCEGCILGKQHRLSFLKDERKRQENPGDLIHGDLCGPMSTISVGGSSYFLLLKDDCTNYMFVYFIRKKSQVMEKMQQFLLDWRVLSRRKIQRIRTDNGGEFMGKQFKSWLLNKSIRHETSVPYVPQQNGFIERSNRTVVEATRSMLHSSGVPLSLWAEATQTAVHVLNLIPSKSLGYKSPTEQLTGIQGTIDHLRVFGSDAYVLKHEHQRKKLDAKAEKGILVGYSTNNNAYRIFLGGKRLVVAKDVLIRERIINQTFLDSMKTNVASMMKKEPMTPLKENDHEFAMDICLPRDPMTPNQTNSSSVGAVQDELTQSSQPHGPSSTSQNFQSTSKRVTPCILSQMRNSEPRPERIVSEYASHETGLDCEDSNHINQDIQTLGQEHHEQHDDTPRVNSLSISPREVFEHTESRHDSLVSNLSRVIPEASDTGQEAANHRNKGAMTRSMTLKKKALESNLEIQLERCDNYFNPSVNLSDS